MSCFYPEIQVKTRNAVYEEFFKIVKRFEELLNVSEFYVVILLSKFKWNYVKFLDFYQNTSEEFDLFEYIELAKVSTIQEFKCDICLENSDEGIQCQCCSTKFCYQCLNGNVEANTTSLNPFCNCPGFRCEKKLDLGGQKNKLYELVKPYIFQNYVICSDFIKECVSPNCENYVCSATMEKTFSEVYCESCNSNWCFTCQSYSHEPISCKLHERWRVILYSQGLSGEDIYKNKTLEWLENNTKNCPKCDKVIYKDGGCNHIKCSQCGIHFCWDCMQYFERWNVRHERCIKKKWKKTKKVMEPEKTKEFYVLKRFVEKAEKIAFCKSILDKKKQGIYKDCIRTLFYATKIMMFWEIMHYFIVENDLHLIDDTYLEEIDKTRIEFCLFHVNGLKNNLNLLEEFIREPKKKGHLGGSHNVVMKVVEIILEVIKDNFMRFPQRLEVPDFRKINTINIKAYNITDQFNIETAEKTFKERDKKEKIMEDTFRFDQPEDFGYEKRSTSGYQRDTVRALQQSMLTYTIEQYQKENEDVEMALMLSTKEF